MINEQSFLKTIQNAENDARLIYADWLDEHGRGEESESQRRRAIFRREISMKPGFDYRNDPDESRRGLGCHGMDLKFLLHGPKATISFTVYTGWLPNWEGVMSRPVHGPIPADLGYHADSPQYDDHKAFECTLRPNGKCYCDGSTLNAEEPFKILLEKGEEAVWKHLEDYYFGRFEKSLDKNNEAD